MSASETNGMPDTSALTLDRLRSLFRERFVGRITVHCGPEGVTKMDKLEVTRPARELERSRVKRPRPVEEMEEEES